MAKIGKQRSYYLLEVTHVKPIPDATDVFAGRLYSHPSISGHGDVVVRAISQDAGWAAIERDKGNLEKRMTCD